LLAAVGTLMVVLLVYLAVLSPPESKTLSRAQESRLGLNRLEAGRQALRQGKFQLAVREFDAISSPHPENTELTQLSRQAALMVDLLAEPLEDILQLAAELNERDELEWQAVFSKRYFQKSVIFDTEVRREAPGRYQWDYVLFHRSRPARANLDNVQLLHQLPLQKPQRLLFGLRLASVQLETGGKWTVHFVPDSGVLLTDADAVKACCSRPIEGLEEVLKRQRGWVYNND
jgi:hypothetical protein